MKVLSFFAPNLNNKEKALLNIGYTINKLGNIFDKKITNRIFNDLSDELKNNYTYLTQFFCNDLGRFIYKNNECYCHIGLFNNHCQSYGIEFWGKSGNLVFQIIFGCLYFVLFCIMILRFISNLKNYNYFFSSLITPKTLVILNLIVLTLFKFIYMIIDPYCQYQKINYTFDRTIDELKFSAIISIYLILFNVFIGLNTNLNRGKGEINKNKYVLVYKLIKCLIIIILCIIYPTQIALSIQMSHNYKEIGGMIYLLFFGLFLSLCLFIFTFWMIFYLRDKIFKYYQIRKENLRKEKIKITKLSTYNLNTESNLKDNELLNHKHLSQRNIPVKRNNYIFDFLKIAIESNLIKEVDKAIDKNENNFDMDNYELIDFENEMLILDLYKKEELNDLNLNKMNDSEKQIPKVNNEIEEDYLLNEIDLKIVNDIFSFSFLYMIVTIEFVIYNIISRFQLFSNYSYLMFTIFFIIHLVDAQYIIIIYFVFFKNTIIQEYQNLKYIGELDKLTLKKKNGHKYYMCYNNLKNSIIFPRFNDFINFYEENK